LPSDGAFILAVVIMTAAAFATRIAGAVLMSWVTPTARTERFLDGLSASVIAALVASQLMSAEANNSAAVVMAIIVVLLTQNVVWAMLGGMVTAAAYPFLTTI